MKHAVTPSIEYEQEGSIFSSELNFFDDNYLNLQEDLNVVRDHFTEVITDENTVPLSVFSSKNSGLQSLVHYLRSSGLNFSEISRSLNRDPRTIWTSFNSLKTKPKFSEEGQRIPLTIFSNRSLGILEALVFYLREQGLKNKDIALALKLDVRTTSTCYSRAKRKLGGAL